MEGLQYEIRDLVINRNILLFNKIDVHVRKHELEIGGAILSVPKHPRVNQTLFVCSIPSA